MDKEKTHINLVVIGHVDSGKSTTCGRLLYEMGSIDAREIEKLQKEAEERGMGSFVFAYVMDQTKSERDRGITIDISLMQFQTPKNHYTIIDAPGHRDFIKNMITGTAQADVAMLVIAAPTGEFEAGISSEGQTREHALLAFTLGVKQLIVAVNQMDEQTVNFSEERYQNIKSEMNMFLKQTGFDPSKVSFLPTSGFNGYNIMEKCDKMDWYKGPTLLEILDSIIPPKRPTDKPLRIPVQGGYKIKGVGTVVTGRVESGVLKVGKTVKFSNSGFTGEVRSIERHHEILTEAIPGDNIGFNIGGIAVKDVVKGSVVGDDQNSPPRDCESFIAQVIILNHPGEIRNGYTPVINCHSNQVAATFTKILSKIDRRSGAVIENQPSGLKSGDSALVLMTPIKPICVENFNEFPSLGRFAARDMKLTVAVGVIKEINFSK